MNYSGAYNNETESMGSRGDLLLNALNFLETVSNMEL